MVPGHEFYGRIAALGEGAEGKYRIGERVIAEQIVPCWECRYCKSGSYWMCETHNIYGFQKDVAEGGMAEYMRFSENAIVHKIPESLSHAAMRPALAGNSGQVRPSAAGRSARRAML